MWPSLRSSRCSPARDRRARRANGPRLLGCVMLTGPSPMPARAVAGGAVAVNCVRPFSSERERHRARVLRARRAPASSFGLHRGRRSAARRGTVPSGGMKALDRARRRADLLERLHRLLPLHLREPASPTTAPSSPPCVVEQQRRAREEAAATARSALRLDKARPPSRGGRAAAPSISATSRSLQLTARPNSSAEKRAL